MGHILGRPFPGLRWMGDGAIRGAMKPMTSKGTVLFALLAVTPALAQSEPSRTVDDHSVAGNTQQAAGQLGEINKKLGSIIERMDAVAARRRPLAIPTGAPCANGSCDERADALCRKLGFAHGLVVDPDPSSASTWLCVDQPAH